MKTHLILIFALCLISCSSETVDYREDYVGVYECKKSNRSFNDPLAVIADDITIESDTNSDSIIVMNGVKLMISGEGETGLVTTPTDIYSLSISGDSLKFMTYPNVLGDVALCFISGQKK